MESIRVVALLTAATGVAVFSTFLLQILGAVFRGSDAAGIVCLAVWPLLGFVTIWLCVKAIKDAHRKGAVLIYLVFLTPFALGYPGSMLLLWVASTFGGCGPMP